VSFWNAFDEVAFSLLTRDLFSWAEEKTCFKLKSIRDSNSERN
jgi:hypothetical protein